MLTAAMSLWFDQLLNTALRELSAHTKVYDALVGSTIVVRVPYVTILNRYQHALFTATPSMDHLGMYGSINSVLWFSDPFKGWYAIHREMKRTMVVFLAIALFFLTGQLSIRTGHNRILTSSLLGWGLMFYSIIYRW